MFPDGLASLINQPEQQVSLIFMKFNTVTLAGTAILAALVVVLDYASKYSNLKIPFPLLPYLKFDFTGIPIVISALVFGLIPGALTSLVASGAILARSGDVVGSSMKGLAEFSTVVGMIVGLKLFTRLKIVGSIASGLTSRVLIMTVVNLALVYTGVMLLPSAYESVSWLWILLVGTFNVMQGAVSAVGGYIVYQAIKRRAPSLISRCNGQRSSV